MTGAAASYFAAWAAIRLRAVLRDEIWADERQGFDLILAATLMRLG